MVSRQKKPNAGGRASSSKAKKASTASAEAKKLQKVLQKCHGANLAQSLCDSLETATPESVETLKALIAPLLKAAATKKHCARCHASFNEAENHDEACVVKCDEGDFGDRTWDGEGVVEMSCCGKRWTESEAENVTEEDEVCYKTSHTADPRRVAYAEDCDSEEDVELDYTGTNQSVVTCKSHGCKVKKAKK
jgi:hypothetical protein